MNKQRWIVFAAALALMGGGAGLLTNLRAHQRLGLAGVRTIPLAGGRNVQVVLPPNVLDYESEALEVDAITTNTLPSDTSYGQRLYTAPDKFRVSVSVVLMGSDRTSLHKPQYCLQGQGWQLDRSGALTTTVPIQRPYPYDLPVVRLLASKEMTDANGQKRTARGVYVYWYVADGAISASSSGFQRMWWMARDLLRTGVLQRWAYISYFAVCYPGQEEGAFERIKRHIAASAPEFQLTPRAAETTSVTARH
jgi:hypothetical protein